VPKEVLAPVYGAGDVGAELLRLPVNGVFFTGSVATGRKVCNTQAARHIPPPQRAHSVTHNFACVQINEAVASRMIKVGLELGGKDATYVCEDANVKVR
jgi:acyl-CoA reductase-like NAD-dependent aldehyde dehydrogenase